MSDTAEPEDDGSFNEAIRTLAEKLEERAKKIGLYLEGAGISIGSSEDIAKEQGDEPLTAARLKELIQSDESEVLLTTAFVIGDVAFSKRVQNPEQDKVDDEVRGMLPTQLEEMRERIERARAEGKDFLDIDPLGGDEGA